MSLKSYFVHYKNKYHGTCHLSENSLDVYDAAGEHCVALRKNGAGQIVDCSKEFGCKDEHDLAPIEQKFRAHKLYKDGNVGKSEEFADRFPVAKEAIAKEGKIYSEKEWDKVKKERAEAAKKAH